MLQIENVSKHFHSKRNRLLVLDDISLSVGKGEFLCITGPSGCGKTTLINIIAGLEQASEGRVRMNGAEIKGPGSDRAVVFQEPALFPWLTVIENVEFPLKTAGVPKEKRRADAMKCLETVHLSKFANAYVHELSGGMKQRAALARALTMDSEVLLMDEPFAALDSKAKEQLQEELQSIWFETKKTVIFITHNLSEAVFLADRIIHMSEDPGRIRAEYTIDLPRPRKAGSPEMQDQVAKLAAHFREGASDEEED
jgi:NitT/TauT family transport system ATP-binding protein